jgi:DNA-binding winged helix-turn-helix (wHTH) protein/Tol biopolymer transport system component
MRQQNLKGQSFVLKSCQESSRSSMSLRRGQLFEFGQFQLDIPARTLRRQRVLVKLNPRAFDVLSYLVQNPGKVLTRDELVKNVWADAFVDEHSLAQCISVLRRALEEKPGDNSYIVTLPGRGYQFVSEVHMVASGTGDTPQDLATEGRLVFQKSTVETSVTTKEEQRQPALPVSRGRLLGRTVVAALAVTIIAAVAFRFQAQRHLRAKHELIERQLTANPPENSISAQAISRDGKYLAYTDFLSSNLYLLAIDSGELRLIPMPALYQPVDWFADGTHLLLENARNGELWKMSIMDSSLPKLWSGGAGLAAVAPDGSHIAFVVDGHEIWLMGPDGEEPQKILTSPDVSGLAWSPTSRRLAYVVSGGTSDKRQITIETCDLAGSTRYVVLSNPHLSGIDGISGITWLPDGRILHSIYSNSVDADLWAIKADPGSGKRSGDPIHLTGWKNFQAREPQASADGKRLIALRHHTQSSVYVTDLAIGNPSFTSHRITADDWYNYVADWTKDSKSILFHSKRNGRWAIFKQPIDGTSPETLVAGAENYFLPKLSYHGDLLYSASASPDRWEPTDTTIRLMSTPQQGGARSTLIIGRYTYTCSPSPSFPCVVAERQDNRLIFFHLDPAKGKGEEIASIASKQADPRWDLSPDGERLAIVDESSEKPEIRILKTADRTMTALPVRNSRWDWSTQIWLSQVCWAADSKSWFVLAQSGSSNDLLAVDPMGNSRVLQEMPAGAGWISSIVASPDGKHLAFTKRSNVDDVMLLENF